MLTSMIDCAYYQRGGICSFGCWEEPRCVTEEPYGGWLHQEAEQLRELAWGHRGYDHGRVKHYRDLTRQVEKREVRLLQDYESNRSTK